MRQTSLQRDEVAPARGDEVFEARELRQPHRGLHIGDLQVIAEVGVRVLVVVALRQIAQLPVEALACRCCPCPARNSNRGPSRGMDSKMRLVMPSCVNTAPPSPMVM